MAPGVDPGKLRTRSRAWLLAAALALLLCPLPASAQLPPDEAWRTLDTPHFRVTFPADLEPLARRAGARAEVAWTDLATIVPPPDGRVDLVVTDHVDHTNGYAAVSPRRRIVVYARPPVDGLGLGYYDEWMELVITHELAHVFQFETAGPLGRVLRGVFGRAPAPWPFFPNQGVPAWMSEGLAVYYESAFTTSGRGEGTYHDMLLRTAALEGKLEDIDQASGSSPIWPAGDRPYVYGSQFFEWLSKRHGLEWIGTFIRAIGDQIVPYRFDDAGRRAFGTSLSSEWRVWKSELETDAEATLAALARRAPITALEPIAADAYYVLQPKISPDGTRLAFARADGLTDPQIRSTALDGTDSRQLARTNDASFFTWMPDGSVVVAQLDYADPYRLYSDLWRVRPDGSTSRITTNARLDHPAGERDGAHVLAVRASGGATELVRVDASSGAIEPLVPAEPDVAWAFPAPSPDGRYVAAARHVAGRFDIVLLDARTGRIVQQVTDDRAVDTSPTWSPDGHFLLWSSDRSGIPNVLAVAVDAQGRLGPIRQVTNVASGVAYPSVDPETRWIYLAGYHANGWAIERVPFDPSRWTDPFPLAPLYASSALPAAPSADPTTPARDYSAAETLRPLYWEPRVGGPLVVDFANGKTVELLGPTLGFFTEAEDVVGRHSIGLHAEVSSTRGARFIGDLDYRYFGLGNPALGLRLSQSWDASGPILGQKNLPAVDTLYRRERERSAAVGATLWLPDFRVAAQLNASAGIVETKKQQLDRDLKPSLLYPLSEPTSRLADFSLTGSASTARAHAFSISKEEGSSITLRLHARRDLERSVFDDSYQEAIAQVRSFVPVGVFGPWRPVLAVRASGGVARGPGADRFHFDAGGASGQSEGLTGFDLFGDPETFPVRGYPSGTVFGRYAWSTAWEIRFPIARLNRGIGLVPMNLEAIHADIFYDEGNAWGPAGNPRRAAIASFGAELSFDTFLLFSTRVPIRVGVAKTRNLGSSVYLRFGPSF